MPLEQRLADLEKNLELLYKKLGAIEAAREKTADELARFSYQQSIQEDIKPKIREWEAEYWKLLTRQPNLLQIDESDADGAVVEVVQVVEQVQQSNANQYPDELMRLLTKILNKLGEPGQSSATKLKATLPLLPPFLSYEMELDTGGFLQQVFPTFRWLFKKSAQGNITAKTIEIPQQNNATQLEAELLILKKIEDVLVNDKDTKVADDNLRKWKRRVTQIIKCDDIYDIQPDLNQKTPYDQIRNSIKKYRIFIKQSLN